MRLFLASLPQEFAGFLKHCRDVRPERLPVHWARSGLFQQKPFLAIANGAGPARAFAAVGGPDLELVCNIGFCGALDPALRIADVIAATRVNGEPVPALDSSRPAHQGPIFSSHHVVRTVAEKRTLYAAGDIAVEMEAAGALRRSQSLGVPFCAVKAVSDLAGEELHCDFNRALSDDGRINYVRLGIEAGKSPFRCLPELIRLGKRAALASESLGEFLASCRF